MYAYGRRTRIAALAGLSALTDLVIFCTVKAHGLTLRDASLAAFAAGAALFIAPQFASRRCLPRIAALAAGILLALPLRDGVLTLLGQRWGWPLPLAAAVAIPLGMLVLWQACACTEARDDALAGSGARRWAAGLIAYGILLRLVYLGQVELIPEEAYYWNYARHLDIGYLDHPPMVAWLIRLGTALFGQTEFGVRIGALCSAGIMSWYAYRLTHNLFGAPSALAVLVLAQALPFFFFSGVLMTPDALLAAAWSAALYYLERALVGGEARSWRGVGVSLGLGLLCKYTILLLGLMVVAFVLIDPKSRRWLKRPEPYAAAAVALLFFAPVVAWNAQHHWASFAFQTSRRLAEAPRFAAGNLLISILVLLTPTGAWAAGQALIEGAGKASHRAPPDDERRRWLFIRLGVLVPFLVFLVFSLRHEVKLDWTGCLWLAMLPGLAAGIAAPGPSPSPALRSAWKATIAAMLIVYAASLQYLVLGIPGVGYSRHLELLPVGWRELGGQIDVVRRRIRESGAGDPLLVGMDRNFIASELAFYCRDGGNVPAETSSANLFGSTGLMYEWWTPAARQDGRTMLLVAWNSADLAGPAIESRAASLDPVQRGALTRDGRLVREYFYRTLHGYRSAPRVDQDGAP